MSRQFKFFHAALAAGIIFTSSCNMKDRGSDVFQFSEDQTKVMLNEIGAIDHDILTVSSDGREWEKPFAPRTINKEGDLHLVRSKDWTSGFFPGVLWYLYEKTGSEQWRAEAEKFTAKVEREKWNGGTHDMGFKINCSFGNGLRLTGNEQYKDIIIQSAQTLMTRYKPAVGCLRSWDHNTDKWQCPVIIDNMMNLELLFLATKLTGDSSFYNVAVKHAETTMKNHFREDYSSYHVIDYDTLTGEVLKRNTHQGYSHESAWARGQAWGLYGYTMCYRETKDERFLDLAKKIESYLFNHPNMPDDLVTYWDFNAPEIPNEPRDVSAAAIMASALYELSVHSNDNRYKTRADKIIESLTANYTSKPGENHGFILGQSVGSKPGNSEISVPLAYADYYFLEALLRKEALMQNGPDKMAVK